MEASLQHSARSSFRCLLLLLLLLPLVSLLPTPAQGKVKKKNSKSCTINSHVASFTVSGNLRIMSTNGCPGYVTKQPKKESLKYFLPLNPVMSGTTPTSVGLGGCALGPVGVALNGMAFFSPCDALQRNALLFEGRTFDNCGGHKTPMGLYHYHVLPGTSNALSVYSSQNNDFTFCAKAFWKPTAGTHSPLVGFLADGIPIYGPLAAGGGLPKDLDTCNGHATDLGFYHYHATSNLPFLVSCLKGCVDITYWPRLGFAQCTPASSQYNYSSLHEVIAA